MIYCLNPDCSRPYNTDGTDSCQSCGSILKDCLRNHYKIIKAIGQGGFGKTYLAQDRDRLNQLCVVKQLVFNDRGTQTNKKIKDLFDREAQQLQLLGSHPQIPTLLAYFEEDNYLYLVQQLIKGHNLKQKLKKEGIFDESKVRKLLRDLLPVLEFVHSKGIIHRDIKPSNIMYSEDLDRYVLIDFGVSKTITSSIMQTGTSLGSQGYAAPEQLLKGKAIIASDLYSLGVTCFELLSGVRPFEMCINRGYTWIESWQKSIETPLSSEFVAILDRLLQYDATLRYQQTSQVLNDLQIPEITSSANVNKEISATTIKPPFQDYSNKRKFSMQLSAGIFAILLIGGYSLTRFQPQFLSNFLSPEKLDDGDRSLSSASNISAQPRAEDKTVFRSTKKNFNEINDVPAGLFNYGGSTTWASIRARLDPSVQIVWPDFELRYTNPINANPGSGTGIQMLLNDQLSFSQSSRPLQDKEYQTAKIRGFTLEEIPVAIDAIAIAAHPSLPVEGLTIAQLQDIYTGKITNWQAVGGPDLPIVPYSRHPQEGGTVEFFVKNVLQNQKFGSNVVLVSDTTAGLRKVASTPGGIYYASAIQVIPQCSIKALPIARQGDNFVSLYQEPKIPTSQCGSRRNKIDRSVVRNGNYLITRRLFVIVKKDGQQDEKAGLAYAQLLLTAQGQKLINQAGFISILPSAD